MFSTDSTLSRLKSTNTLQKTAFESLLGSYPDHQAAQSAIRLIEHTKASVFLTGAAGCGKTHLAAQIRKSLQKKWLLFSPTAEIALRIGGQSIFSFFGLASSIYVPNQHAIPTLSAEKIKILAHCELIMIEQVGILRCDHMQLIDVMLRHYLKSERPFAGKQMILMGDLYQIPPNLEQLDKKSIQLLQAHYSSRYFFGASCFQQNFKFHLVELKTNYRHQDEGFKDLLNAVRYNSIDENQLTSLNARCTQDHSIQKVDKIMLCSMPQTAEHINQQKLDALDGPQLNFKAAVAGIQLEKTQYPCDYILGLKIGAHVVFVNKDSQSRWTKGSLGTVYNIYENYLEISIRQRKQEKTIKVERFNWSVKEHQWDPKSNSYHLNTVGDFSQFPIRLGWSMSVQQAQGFSFDHIYIKLDRRNFAAGLTYAALSRCKTLKGIYLKRPFLREDIFSDKRIARFIDSENKKNHWSDQAYFWQQNTIIEALEKAKLSEQAKQQDVGYKLSEQAQKIEWQAADIQAAKQNLKNLEQKNASLLNQQAMHESTLNQSEKTKAALQMLLVFLLLVILSMFFS